MEKTKLTGIFLLSVNIFGILSWLFPDSSGILGRIFVESIKKFFGVYFLPFFIIEILFVYCLLKNKFNFNIFISLILYLLSLFGLFSVIILLFNLKISRGIIGTLISKIVPYLGIGGLLVFSFVFLIFAMFLSSSFGFLRKLRFNIYKDKGKIEKEIKKTKVEIQSADSKSTKENSKLFEIISVEKKKDRKNVKDIHKSFNFSIPTSVLTYSPSKSENEDYAQIAKNLEETLKSFKIDAKVKDWNVGPSVIRYNITLAPGIRVSRVLSLSNDIALALAVPSVRFEAPVPGKSVIGVEIPRSKPVKVYLREILESETFKESSHLLTIALGKDLIGNIKVGNLSEMLHLLIAGTTGSGKSMFINSLILSLLYKNTPNTLNFLMIDPKRVELSVYNKLLGRYLRHQVVNEPKKAVFALRWAVSEMERRYELFEKYEVRNIEEYKNLRLNTENLPYIVIIIDELNDLMMTSPKEIEDLICRLAQKARAAGIHLVVATQRPSVDVITGLIKANIPSRIAFAVSSQIDSRIILDDSGAEKLIGKGDMLYHPINSSYPIRLQAPYVDEKDIKNVVNYILENIPEVDYEPISLESLEVTKEEELSDVDDPLLPKVIELLKGRKIISTSYIQRKFSIGYNRAARLLDILEEKGYVASQGEGKPRKVLKGGDEI